MRRCHRNARTARNIAHCGGLTAGVVVGVDVIQNLLLLCSVHEHLQVKQVVSGNGIITHENEVVKRIGTKCFDF